MTNPKVYLEYEFSSIGKKIPKYLDPPRNCTENECVCIPNNLVCNATELGDGKCQDYNNGPLCDYDLGDCCLRWLPDFDIDECCKCSCHFGPTFFFTEEFSQEIFGWK